MNKLIWPALASVLFLSACGPAKQEVREPASPANPAVEQQREQELRKSLPADADFSRLADQQILMGRGLYLTRDGQYRPLLQRPAEVAWREDGRPPVAVEEAPASKAVPIRLELPGK